MNSLLSRAAQTAIAIALIGSVVVQAMILPAIYRDLTDAPPVARVTFVVLLGLGILALQVFAVCVWRLLTRVRAGTVFAVGAFREIDVIAWSLGVVVVVLVTIALMLAPGGTAPGAVGLIGGAAVVICGVVLLVRVMKGLLRQAIAREDEVVGLRTELGEVI
ncbi:MULTISPECIES: DUF2975 domain-containing protein [Microbacterium]|uniref:DUF2975 domain-containing protein n=1 Tax=Microbacterium TaxID=33882 RepID=UPI002785F251|nr:MULTISPECIES: DUF2975 domain-containing protein [Microbacterium]MDQ1083110.1 hypothetical protein [Microbacterium sp. SORGH_AS_0344]MDQ1171618.1 hypothetical protein [Microbacterium proteolyticum]